mmetsp:Transcript_17330/g.48025  ORF Transcript_17330/g.48025 Transcript_17330/m.48025 type:complete len:206 (+) Transcript_17330:577-1194(+)
MGLLILVVRPFPVGSQIDDAGRFHCIGQIRSVFVDAERTPQLLAVLLAKAQEVSLAPIGIVGIALVGVLGVVGKLLQSPDLTERQGCLPVGKNDVGDAPDVVLRATCVGVHGQQGRSAIEVGSRDGGVGGCLLIGLGKGALVKVDGHVETAELRDDALDADAVDMAHDALAEELLGAEMLLVARDVGRGLASGIDGDDVQIGHGG